MQIVSIYLCNNQSHPYIVRQGMMESQAIWNESNVYLVINQNSPYTRILPKKDSPLAIKCIFAECYMKFITISINVSFLLTNCRELRL